MTYTEDEICDIYRHAKDKEAEFRILLELTRADRDTLKEILLTHGLIKPTKAKCPRCGHDFDKVFHQKICSLCEKEVRELRNLLHSKKTIRNLGKARAAASLNRLEVEIKDIQRKIKKKEET